MQSLRIPIISMTGPTIGFDGFTAGQPTACSISSTKKAYSISTI